MKPPVKKPIDYLAIIKRLQSLLNKQEQKYTNQIIEAYKKGYKSLLPYIRNIELLIEKDPKITPAAIKKSPEFRNLVKKTDEELNDFTSYARTTIGIAISAAALLALKSVSQWGMKPLQPNAVDVVTRFLRPDTELYKRIGLWAGNARDGVIQSIVKGVGLGKNPRVIAADITRAFGTELTDALRTTRTSQLWAYRESTRLNYIANGVSGWIWLAELDEVTCGACAAMHGTFHTNEEQLDGHYNCRCAMIPATAADAIKQSGEDFFNSLSEEQQDKMLGRGKAQALRDGKFAFSDLVRQDADKTYGHMRIEVPLKDLVNE